MPVLNCCAFHIVFKRCFVHNQICCMTEIARQVTECSLQQLRIDNYLSRESPKIATFLPFTSGLWTSAGLIILPLCSISFPRASFPQSGEFLSPNCSSLSLSRRPFIDGSSKTYPNEGAWWRSSTAVTVTLLLSLQSFQIFWPWYSVGWIWRPVQD